MTIFAIIPQPSTDLPNLGLAVERLYPDDFYELGDGMWLISDVTSAVEVCKKLGISSDSEGNPGVVSSGLVIEVASYFGRANPAIWSWIKSKWEGGPHG